MKEFKSLINYLQKLEIRGVQFMLQGLSRETTIAKIYKYFKNDTAFPIETEFTEELLSLYSVSGGSEDCPDEQLENVWWFSNFTFISLESSFHIREEYLRQRFIRNRYFLPIFAEGAGEVLLYDLSGEKNPIYFYSPGITEMPEPVTIYENLSNMFITLNTYFSVACYLIEPLDDDYFWDDVLEWSISRELNPNCSFWKE